MSERHALESLFTDLKWLITTRAGFIKRPVEFPDAGLSDPKTRAAVERGAVDGKPFGLISLGSGEAKAHLAFVRVDGLAPEAAQRLGLFSP